MPADPQLPPLPPEPPAPPSSEAAGAGGAAEGGADAAAERPRAIGVEFSDGGRDLSAAVALPTRVPPAPQAPAAPKTPQPALEAGYMFGGYELLAKIGEGGMGMVFKARQVSLDRIVAIKILSRVLHDNEEFIKRFQHEARAIARIPHPNIVTVYDFGQLDGLHYMVTEFVDGQSLARRIAERGFVPAAELIPIIVQCLAGLHHVAAQGIVHRDIKPDNILITREGVAKIADFGLAKDVSSKKDEHSDLTQHGLAMGTPAYMSPEQCMGQPLDGRTDQYALGVTAWYALTGQKPFTGNTAFEIMTKQREYLPPPPHEVQPSVPREVSLVVMRMLAKRADERFPDAAVCRQAWLEVGIRLGIFGRSEVEIARATSVELPTVQAPGASISGEHAVERARSARSPQPAAEPPRPEAARLAAGERHGSERQERARTVTCPKCGHLNRSEAAVCGRCGQPLRTLDAISLPAQDAEAQRLFDAKRYSEAAALWAQLADREPDKRLRSVLRSKESEARRQAQLARIQDLRAKAAAAAARGDLRGALLILEQGREGRDAAASTTSSALCVVELEQEIAALRQRLERRRRWRRALLALALLAALLAALAWWRQLPAAFGAPASAPANRGSGAP